MPVRPNRPALCDECIVASRPRRHVKLLVSVRVDIDVVASSDRPLTTEHDGRIVADVATE
jgi:hypothetical protein